MTDNVFNSISEGDEYSFVVENFNRTQFVKYAGAGGDFNPIHHDQTFAEAAGLPTVFGMGMLTSGMLGRVLTDWFGATSVKKYGFRFKQRLWPGDVVTFKGVVAKVYDESGTKHVDVNLSAVNQNGDVLVEGTGTCRPWSA
ncbi:MAG: MaoC/PaaZ C-terminal domain-containing protein [Pseudomonadota bacterium]|nr:MaoC/PaaZ C-terminal domain-containing protein [Pseudomonadota bacterium]